MFANVRYIHREKEADKRYRKRECVCVCIFVYVFGREEGGEEEGMKNRDSTKLTKNNDCKIY